MQRCKMDDCDKETLARGLCKTHYMLWWRYGDPSVSKVRHNPNPYNGFNHIHHGEYQIHSGLRNRCYNKNNHKYPTYGGRGIDVCDRWLGKQGFRNFYTDMGDRPTTRHSIDRIDNDGDYEPNNCRWATPREQCINRSMTRFYTINGVTRCVREWANHSDVKYETILSRLNRGIAIEKAIQ